AGVFQTREGINFRVIELDERRALGLYTSLDGLAAVIRRERPDAVIVIENYLYMFLFHAPVIAAMKSTGAKLVLKAIPFMIPSYDEAMRVVHNCPPGFHFLPPFANSTLQT